MPLPQSLCCCCPGNIPWKILGGVGRQARAGHRRAVGGGVAGAGAGRDSPAPHTTWSTLSFPFPSQSPPWLGSALMGLSGGCRAKTLHTQHPCVNPESGRLILAEMGRGQWAGCGHSVHLCAFNRSSVIPLVLRLSTMEREVTWYAPFSDGICPLGGIILCWRFHHHHHCQTGM